MRYGWLRSRVSEASEPRPFLVRLLASPYDFVEAAIYPPSVPPEEGVSGHQTLAKQTSSAPVTHDSYAAAPREVFGSS